MKVRKASVRLGVAIAFADGIFHRKEGLTIQLWMKEQVNSARAGLTTLPLRFGGLGLRSAQRTGAAAYWASWADTLAMMKARCPQLAETFCAELEAGNSNA